MKHDMRDGDRVQKKPRRHSPLSMVSFDHDGEDSCLRSFSKTKSKRDPGSLSCRLGDSLSTRMTTRKPAKGAVIPPVESAFIVQMPKRMVEAEKNSGRGSSFWPASATVTGAGQIRRVEVGSDDSEELADFVERHGGTWQEERPDA